MQDKIQEIMGLVDALSVECIALGIGQMASSAGDNATLRDDFKKSRAELQSKLRELVREPLSGEQREELFESRFDHDHPVGFVYDDIVRDVERAHNITNTSEKQ